MTTAGIQRQLNGFRFVAVERGDTLQRIAARELGDAARWPEIVGLNGLLPPFITDDPAEARAGVVLSGGFLRVPAAEALVSAEASPEEVFGRDVYLRAGRVDVSAGDFAVVGGTENLRQALTNAIVTERGELIFHPGYGCLIRQVVGTVNGPTAAVLSAQYAKSTMLADARVRSVSKADAAVYGERVTVDIEVVPIDGKAVDVSATI